MSTEDILYTTFATLGALWVIGKTFLLIAWVNRWRQRVVNAHENFEFCQKQINRIWTKLDDMDRIEKEARKGRSK